MTAIAAETQPGSERLLATLVWMLPIDEEARVEEMAGSSLIALPPEERLAAQTRPSAAVRIGRPRRQPPASAMLPQRTSSLRPFRTTEDR
jgi:hypothetical protein